MTETNKLYDEIIKDLRSDIPLSKILPNLTEFADLNNKSKLGQFVKLERDGYSKLKVKDAPVCREVSGDYTYVKLDEKERGRPLRKKRKIGDSVSKLEMLAQKEQLPGEEIIIHLSEDLSEDQAWDELFSKQRAEKIYFVQFHYSASEIPRILKAIRNEILYRVKEYAPKDTAKPEIKEVVEVKTDNKIYFFNKGATWGVGLNKENIQDVPDTFGMHYINYYINNPGLHQNNEIELLVKKDLNIKATKKELKQEALELSYATKRKWQWHDKYYDIQINYSDGSGRHILRKVDIDKKYAIYAYKKDNYNLGALVKFVTECKPNSKIITSKKFGDGKPIVLKCNEDGDALSYAVEWESGDTNFIYENDIDGFKFRINFRHWDFTKLDQEITLKKAK